MAKRNNGIVLNKFGVEKPTPVMTRLMEKQKSKIRKNARPGDRSAYVRRAIDAYEGD